MYNVTLKKLMMKRFVDITDDIGRVVQDSKIVDGLVNVFVCHTTCGVKIMENEVLSFVDISNHLERVVPDDGMYQHDRVELRMVSADERVNGCSHVRMLYFPASVTLPVLKGGLALGEWQRVVLAEMDYGQPFREREVLVSVLPDPMPLVGKDVYCD